MNTDQQPTPPPTLRVVHGDPTPEELAVIVALLSAAGGGASSVGSRSSWSGRMRTSWRRSTLPG